jgi:hypothetical protein
MANLVNRAAVTVSNVEIQLLAANPKRKWAVIQNTSANPIRVGAVGVTATTGIRLAQGERLVVGEQILGGCPTDQINGIREGGSDGTVSPIEWAD